MPVPSVPPTTSPHLFKGSTRISGPVSYFVFQMPSTGNTMYFFGDFHFSYKNQCPSCDRDASCHHITDFIEKASQDAAARGTSLDVYMEFPYVMASGEGRDRVIANVDQVFTKDGRENMKKALSKLFGKTPEYIGIFSSLYKRFSARFYHHAALPEGLKFESQRFHYSDARFEFNVKSFLSPASDRWIDIFHKKVRDVKTFRKLLEAFVLGHRKSTPFQDEVHHIFGDAIPVFEPSLTSTKKGGKKTLHKISKQVQKLPGPLRKKLESFIEEKLDAICDVLAHDVRYEDGVRLLNMRADQQDNRDGTLTYIRASRLVNYVGIFTIFMELVVQTIMMDTYLLARMLYYANKQEARQGTTIVYAGDFHIRVYADFMTRYMRMKPVGCQTAQKVPLDLTDDEIQNMVQRCIFMEPDKEGRKCDMSTVLPQSSKNVHRRLGRRRKSK